MVLRLAATLSVVVVVVVVAACSSTGTSGGQGATGSGGSGTGGETAGGGGNGGAGGGAGGGILGNGAGGTPIVISFDGAPVEYVTDSSQTFPLDTSGRTSADWPTARTPWLALDRNGNGNIDDGSELFGSMTAIGEGRRAVNGFEALRALDADGDGHITERDPAFAELVLWFDRDGDRRTGAGELLPLAEAGIVSINLRYTSVPRCDRRGNCEVERAPITYRDASNAVRTGAAIDVHFPVVR